MELATLYTDFQKALMSYIRSKTNSKEDAEDILHNVFVKIAGHEDKLAQKENLKNWVFIITRNAVYDYYRSKGIRQHEELGEVSIKNMNDTNTTAPAQSLEVCLLRFIDQLPDTDKHLLIASELKGEKQKELAQQYNMPYSTLKSRVQRGRNKLKQMLTDCCQIEINKRGDILKVSPNNNCAENSCNSCEN